MYLGVVKGNSSMVKPCNSNKGSHPKSRGPSERVAEMGAEGWDVEPGAVVGVEMVGVGVVGVDLVRVGTAAAEARAGVAAVVVGWGRDGRSGG